MSLSADVSKPCTRLPQSLSSHKKEKEKVFLNFIPSFKNPWTLRAERMLQYLAGSPVHSGHSTFLRNWTTSCLAPETNELDTCPGKQLQHLINFTATKIFLSSLILSSSYCYAFV